MLIDVNHESKLKKEGYGQFNTATCWLACYRMLYKWKSEEESKIKPAMEKAGLKFSDLCTRGVYPEEWPTAGSSLGMCGWAGSSVKTWDDEQIVYALKGYGPLFYTWDYGQSGHALLVVGFDKGNGQFKVYNPYNRFEVGTVDVEYMTGPTFRSKLHNDRWALQAWF
jgi:hypothetical protein